MSFPKYAGYKNSGIEWLDEIPEHWDVKELKYACSNFPSNVDKKTIEGQQVVSLCNYTDVYYNEQITTGMQLMKASATDEQIEKFTLRAGDVIITKDSESADDIAVSTYIPADLPGVVCGYHLAMIRPKEGVSGLFIKRLFDSVYIQSKVATLANGLTRMGLSHASISGLELPIPPAEEQTAIANFLDAETAKIDALVSEQQRLIELLKEKRQAVISHAVTKGLNPDAPLKDSGIEWLGKVPEHWEVGPLKRYWSVTDCKHITANFVDDGIPLASIREVQSKWVNLDNAKQTTQEYYELLIEGNREPLAGDLIFSRNATVGEVAQVGEHTPKFAMGQDVCLFRKVHNDASSTYWQYVLRSTEITEQLNVLMVGATFKRINVDEIRNLAVLSPPASEQNEIASFLDQHSQHFETLISDTVRAIELLQERRTALISAAVTGKIDVREYTAQETA